ncbi:RNA polymerase sigma factor [Pseudaminobacter salicylatoxidans]|uniref:RNA polymerase sigma factor n=1 Tax=Pseudaminobacter salicylatoxidans TaxID=93369 RepID=UPI00031F12A5|nr:RNA polymerase sigma factor [Pseudaminobacter salicylatoxidans]
MLTRTRFAERLARHQQRLYGYAVAITGDRERARDLLHDCVERAAGARKSPADDPAFRAWLFTIMRNLWIDQVRADRRHSLATETLGDAMPDMPVSLETTMVNTFAVRQAFERLSHDHREMLALVDISGFSYQEAADLLSVPRGTVMSRISRAREALARLLADDEPTVVPFSRAPRKA